MTRDWTDQYSVWTDPYSISTPTRKSQQKRKKRESSARNKKEEAVSQYNGDKQHKQYILGTQTIYIRRQGAGNKKQEAVSEYKGDRQHEQYIRRQGTPKNREAFKTFKRTKEVSFAFFWAEVQCLMVNITQKDLKVLQQPRATPEAIVKSRAKQSQCLILR